MRGHHHGHHHHGHHHGHRGRNMNNDTGSFILNILLLSFLFDNSNSVGARLVGGFIALVIIALIIYGIYYAIADRKEYFSGDSDELTPSSNEVVVALFYADWCGHCKTFKPHFDKVQAELNGEQCSTSNKKLRIVKVDCSENNKLSNKYNVNGFPTVKIFGANGGETEYSGKREYGDFKSYLLAL